MTNEELIERAKRAYFTRYGKNANQPSVGASYVESCSDPDKTGGGSAAAPGPYEDHPLSFVVLGNVRGELVRYRIGRDGSLRFVK